MVRDHAGQVNHPLLGELWHVAEAPLQPGLVARRPDCREIRQAAGPDSPGQDDRDAWPASPHNLREHKHSAILLRLDCPLRLHEQRALAGWGCGLGAEGAGPGPVQFTNLARLQHEATSISCQFATPASLSNTESCHLEDDVARGRGLGRATGRVDVPVAANFHLCQGSRKPSIQAARPTGRQLRTALPASVAGR